MSPPHHASETESKPKFWMWVERVKLLVEIAAFGVGGVWVLFAFVHEEARTYQERGALDESIDWNQTPEGLCEAEYKITFRNLAKIPVTIGATRVEVWQMPDFTPLRASEKARYIEPLHLRKDPLFDKFIDRFNGTYQPDESDQEGFAFHLNKSVQGHPVLFAISIWDDKGARNLPKEGTKDYSENSGARWRDYHWERPCGDTPPHEISCKVVEVGDHTFKCVTSGDKG